MNKINISLTDAEICNLIKTLKDKSIHYIKIKEFEKAYKSTMLMEKIEHQYHGIK